jgi:integral membrane protein
MVKNSVKKFGIINTVEGYSYLVLLFIAMPLKYVFDFPLAVKIAGMAHGALFTLFCILLVIAWKESKWDFQENIVFFIASLIPFGTFYTKKKILAYAE